MGMALEISLLLMSVFAGVLGSILGLGGGIVVIPALTLAYGVNIRYAIGASIVSVIATSSGAAATYVRDHLTNVRLAIFLEIGTTLGALSGAFIAAYIQSNVLFLLFALLLLQSAYLMWRRGRQTEHSETTETVAHPWAYKMKLNSSYPDALLGKEVPYLVHAVPLGFFYMLGAGLLSGLLGIGSGILKVLAMDSAMKLPIKVSSATSNFMIGVTAAASAGAYYMRGDIIPSLAAPVAIGVLIGSLIGTKIMVHLPAKTIRKFFIVVLLVVAVQMGLRGLGVRL
jgi:uncharacterized membrane protein YfcA